MKKTDLKIHRCAATNDATASCSGQVATRIAQLLADAMAARGRAVLAVSGGRSPVAIFRELRDKPLAWSKVRVTLVDERWVASDSPDSNEHLVREHLLVGEVSAAHFVGLKTAVDSPADALAERQAALIALPWPCDVILLGMGEDGHTASLFPRAAGLAGALDPGQTALLVAIDPPLAPHRRIGLTLAGILQSRHIVLAITGSSKERIFNRALQEADAMELPIAAVLRQTCAPVEVFLG